MTGRILAPLLLLIGLFAGGCQVDTSPQTVQRFGPNQQSILGETEFSGQYKLWRGTLQKEGDFTPTGAAIADLHLEANVPIGFTHSTDGDPIAVAGKQGFPLEKDGHYFWQMNADKGQIDHAKTKRTVLVTGAVVGCVVLIVGGLALSM